jgi:glucose/arabinose dehydrogenase
MDRTLSYRDLRVNDPACGEPAIGLCRMMAEGGCMRRGAWSGWNRSIAAACLALVCVACGRSPSPPPPSIGGGNTITGRERLAWDQEASSAVELAALQYALYVDNDRRVLTSVTCEQVARPQGFGCTAPLPQMASGPRVLELATFVVGASGVRESARSAPLRVTVASLAPASSLMSTSAEPVATIAGVPVAIDVVVDGLTAAVDFAQAPDGRFFIAERHGSVVVADQDGGRAGVALMLSDLRAGRQVELHAVALHPDFDRTRWVYLVYTTAGMEGDRSFEVLRLREAGGRLGEPVVLLDRVPASRTPSSAAARFGPDGRLFVALDDGGEPGLAESFGSFNGKVLRLTDDGRLPDDNPLSSLVYALGHRAPAGFDWHPATRGLWVVDRDGAERDILLRALPGLPVGADRWQISPDFQSGAAGAVFYTRGEVPEWYGDLFVAAADGAHLVHVEFDDRDPGAPRSADRILAGHAGHIRQLAQGRDGALYFSTANPYAVGAGGDVLARVRPVR